jgi:hypothetical protein
MKARCLSGSVILQDGEGTFGLTIRGQTEHNDTFGRGSVVPSYPELHSTLRIGDDWSGSAIHIDSPGISLG